jgi:hypothetical protein
VITFSYSHRDSADLVLASFTTSLHLDFPAQAAPDGIHAAALACGILSAAWLWFGLPTRRFLCRAAPLSASQRTFWQETLCGCLAEFAAVHNLPLNLFSFEAEDCAESPPPPPLPVLDRHRVLVPLGGGKDSVVVWTAISQLPETESAWFYLEDDQGELRRSWRLAALHRVSGAATPVLSAWHNWRCPRWEACRRRRFEPCGHPWAALCCFTAALVALLHGQDAIAVGNERSASEGNGYKNGIFVNHQYDKSLTWEMMSHAYIRLHISPALDYFSALSHLWETQIMRRFARLPSDSFLPLILSCNEPVDGGSRACAACAKCVFVALLLAAFMAHPAAGWAAFGDDPLARHTALPILGALLGRVGTSKPYECVGTAAEARLCLHLARGAYASAGLPLPACLCGPCADADAASGAALEVELMSGCGRHAIPRWAQATCGAAAEMSVRPPPRYVLAG